jgi:hypothetical protein
MVMFTCCCSSPVLGYHLRVFIEVWHEFLTACCRWSVTSFCCLVETSSCKTHTWSNGHKQCVPLAFSATSDEVKFRILLATIKWCYEELDPSCDIAFIKFWTTYSGCEPCGSFEYRFYLSLEVCLACCHESHVGVVNHGLSLHPLFSNSHSTCGLATWNAQLTVPG